MSLDLSPALRAALLGEPTIAGLLTTYLDDSAVFTRTPPPDEALYPFIVVSEDIAIINEDGLRSDRPIVMRDLRVYGHQPDDYRVVEQLGYSIRDLFHRKKESLVLADYVILDITAMGPSAAPTSDDGVVGRVVTLTIRLRKIP